MKDKTTADIQIEIGPLEKKGQKLIDSVNKGNMAAVLSGNEVMYILEQDGQFRTVIHGFGMEDARARTWEMDERNIAMFRNLDAAADQFFEIVFPKEADLMSVMMAAENGIYNFLCSIGDPPGEDIDFMEGYENG